MTDTNLLDFQLLAEIDPAHLPAIKQSLRPLAIDAGQELVSEGLTTHGPLFLVTEGELEVSRQDVNGRRQVLTVFQPPVMIGEMEFLADIESAATVTACSDVRGFLLPRARFEQLFEEGNPAAYHLAREIGRVVSERLAQTNELLTKALAGDQKRLETVRRAQVDEVARHKFDADVDAMLKKLAR